MPSRRLYSADVTWYSVPQPLLRHLACLTKETIAAIVADEELADLCRERRDGGGVTRKCSRKSSLRSRPLHQRPMAKEGPIFNHCLVAKEKLVIGG